MPIIRQVFSAKQAIADGYCGAVQELVEIDDKTYFISGRCSIDI